MMNTMKVKLDNSLYTFDLNEDNQQFKDNDVVLMNMDREVLLKEKAVVREG